MRIQNLSPEAQLLLCCARKQMDDEEIEAVRALLEDGVDWARLLDLSRVHGVMPLVGRHLDAHFGELVPEKILKKIRRHTQANFKRNLFLTGELTRVLHHLNANGITGIPFKGPILAGQVYGDLSLRESSDLDILVRRKDVLRAGQLMRTLGFRSQLCLSDIQKEAYVRAQYEMPYLRDEGRIWIELQWEIVPRYFNFRLEALRLWEGRERSPDDQNGFSTLMPEETLLLLCVHGAKHLWTRLGWICDVAELVRAPEEIDWPKVSEMAKALGAMSMLSLALSLSKDLLGVCLEEEIQGWIEADQRLSGLTAQIRRRLFVEPGKTPRMIESCLFHLKVKESLRERIMYCFRLVTTTTPEDWAVKPLPAFLFPLYGLIRPFRLAEKYTLRGLKRVFLGDHVR